MTFDDVLGDVRALLGNAVSVVIVLNEFGPGDGWLIDTAGELEQVVDPVPGVDQPVHYVRFDDGHGFALERTWFRAAQWNVTAGRRSLDVDLGAVTMSLTQL